MKNQALHTLLDKATGQPEQPKHAAELESLSDELARKLKGGSIGDGDIYLNTTCPGPPTNASCNG